MHFRILKNDLPPEAFLTASECIKFVFVRGSAPDPAGGAYSAPPDHLAGLKWDPTSKQKEREREGRGEGRPPNSLIYPALQGFAGLPLRFVVVDGTCVVVDADY